MVFGVRPGQRLGLGRAQVLHALLRDEVVLHPVPLAGLVHPHVGVRGVAVHGAPALRQAAVTHQVGDLVRGLRVLRPEIPLHRGVAQPRVGQALLGADEVGELHRITQEEDGGVVADQVEVALGGVELQREAADVTPGVGGAELTGDGREAVQHAGLDARLEEGGLGVLRDVLGGLELAEGAGALRVRATLGHVHPVEVSEGLDEMVVVQQDRAVRADRQRVAVADCWDAGLGGRTGGMVSHTVTPVWLVFSVVSGKSRQLRHRPR